jgi:two-component system response regulator
MGKRLHIFLAEDNEGDIVLVREALRHHRIEHELTVARDGAEAVRLLESIGESTEIPCPDLILLDLNLPKFTGHQVMEVLKDLEDCQQIPVIVFTSSSRPSDRTYAEALGFARYFHKPSSLSEYRTLGAAVLEVIHERDGR